MTLLELTASSSPLLDLPAKWFEQFLFTPWPGAAFETNAWKASMRGYAIGLAIVTAAFLLLERRWSLLYTRRAHAAAEAAAPSNTRDDAEAIKSATATKAATKVSLLPEHAKGLARGRRWWRVAGMVLLVAGILSYFDFFNPNTRYRHYYHRHELYHYYLGSKYFQELGYARLYDCTMVAERELGHNITSRNVRDLHHKNMITPVTETASYKNPELCKRHFAPADWEAFKQDIKWFEQSSRGNYWTSMQQDHGYNPAPVWTMTGRFLSNLGTASDGFFKALAGIDVVLHMGILGMLAWAFGWRVAMLASVFWGTNTASNFYWTGGAFLRQDWIFLFVGAMCLARKRYFGLAGAALMWSSLLRVFPIVGFGGWAFIVLRDWFKHKRLLPDHRRLLGGTAIAAAVLIPTSMWICAPDQPSCAEWRGKPVAELNSTDRALCLTEPYASFAAHIVLHKDTPLTNHMGLESILVHNWDGRMRFSRDESYDDAFEPWKTGRNDRKHQRRPWQALIILGLGSAVLWALHRSKALWLSIPFSVPLIISMTNMTCYYYSMFLTVAALTRLRPSIGPAMLAVSAASQVLLQYFYYIDDRYVALSYLFFTLAVLALVPFQRPFSIQALRDWFETLMKLRARKGSATEAAASQTPTTS